MRLCLVVGARGRGGRGGGGPVHLLGRRVRHGPSGVHRQVGGGRVAAAAIKEQLREKGVAKEPARIDPRADGGKGVQATTSAQFGIGRVLIPGPLQEAGQLPAQLRWVTLEPDAAESLRQLGVHAAIKVGPAGIARVRNNLGRGTAPPRRHRAQQRLAAGKEPHFRRHGNGELQNALLRIVLVAN